MYKIDLEQHNQDKERRDQLDKPAFIVETKSLRDILRSLRQAELWLAVAALAAFLASSFFVVKYFVGGSMEPGSWTGEQWLNAALGLGLTAIITAAQAFLYASGYKGIAALFATVLLVFFGLFSEISQSMEREDSTVKERSENSPVFQATLASIRNMTVQASTPMANPYATQIAAAERKVVQCHERREKHCKGDQQAVDSLNRLASQASQSASNANAVALSSTINQAKALEYDEDKHYAMIRLLKEFLGVTGIWASFIFSFIVIGTFEYAFHFVGGYVSDHKRALLMLGRDPQGNLITHDDYGNTATVSGASTVPAATVLSKTATVSAETATVPPSPINDLSRQRFFKLMYTEVRSQVINGAIAPTLPAVTDAVTGVIKQHTKMLGIDPTLIGNPARQKIAAKILSKLEQEMVLDKASGHTADQPKYLLASRWANRPAPDMPVPPPASSTIRREIPRQPALYPGNRALDSSLPSTSPTAPVASANGALETAKARWHMDGNAAMQMEPETLLVTVPETVETVTGTVTVTVTDGLYRDFRSAVLKGQKFTVRPARDWLKPRVGGSNAEREAMAVKMIAKLLNDGIIEDAGRSSQDPRGPYKLKG